MKKTEIFLGSIVYAVYMIVSCIVIMLCEILAIKIVNLFVVTQYFELCIIRAVIYTVGVNALLGVISYREGYRAARFPILDTVISTVIASAIHLVFALLFSFEAFAAGGVRFITALFRFGDALNGNTFMGTLGRADFIPFFILNSLVYIAVIILLGKLGEKNRLKQRESLTGKA